MVFSSLAFLFYFLPLCLFVYFIVKQKWRNVVLLCFSLLFYAYGEPIYIVLMLFSIIADYTFANYIEKAKNKKKKRLFLIFSLVTNIGLLFFFKYFNFFSENIETFLGMELGNVNIALPIGISFYTFQTMSYTIDVYRGEVKASRSLLSFGTFVSLFPQLIAGPIVRYIDVQKELIQREERWDEIWDGVLRFLIGLGKKVLIANQMAIVADTIFSLPESEWNSIIVLTGVLAYALQIYFDFSGYSDMAIGLGAIFGFRFPENFNYPYIARSATEFWRRWHMTLGGWFRDYVYIPLGGNRVSTGKWIRNMFIVWFLTGFWHGAAWTFIVWGLYFGILITLERIILLKNIQKLPTIVQHGYLLIVIGISWIFFRSETMTQATVYIQSLFNFRTVQSVDFYWLKEYAFIFIVALIGSVPNNPYVQWISRYKVLKWLFALCIFIASISYLVRGGYNPFLYFRF